MKAERRAELSVFIRQRKVAAPVARRENALPLMDAGMSDEFVAKAFFLASDTVRAWRREFHKSGAVSTGLAVYPRREGKPDRNREADGREVVPGRPATRHRRNPRRHPTGSWRPVFPRGRHHPDAPTGTGSIGFPPVHGGDPRFPAEPFLGNVNIADTVYGHIHVIANEDAG